MVHRRRATTGPDRSAGRRFGLVGLGRMGEALALQAVDKGIEVVAYDPKTEPGPATGILSDDPDARPGRVGLLPSRDHTQEWEKTVSVLRHLYGGHPLRQT